MNKILKDLFANLLYPFCNLKKSSAVAVLMYHKVDKDLFEEQLLLLKKHYVPLSLKEFEDYLTKDKTIPQNAVLITFDDGYLNNYTEAYPLLKKYSVPAIIFLTSGLIGKTIFSWYDKIYYLAEKNPIKVYFLNTWFNLKNSNEVESLLDKLKQSPQEKRDLLIDKFVGLMHIKLPDKVSEEYAYINWSQAKKMSSIVSFGSHTAYHPILTYMPFSQAKSELIESKQLIEQNLKLPANSFAYPNGDYSAKLVSLVQKTGFTTAFTTRIGKVGIKQNLLTLPRIPVNRKDNYKLLNVKLSFTKLLYGSRMKNQSMKEDY